MQLGLYWRAMDRQSSNGNDDLPELSAPLEIAMHVAISSKAKTRSMTRLSAPACNPLTTNPTAALQRRAPELETSSRASEVTAQEHGPHLGRGPAYFAATNCPRTAPPGLFLLCTFT